MKINLLLIIIISLLGCSGDQETIPRWGYLPDLEPNYSTNRQLCETTVVNSIPNGVQDLGKSLHVFGKKSSGISHTMHLGYKCIIAAVSTSVYEQPEYQSNNHYSITIQVPVEDNRCKEDIKPNFCKNNPISYRVIFQRDLTDDIVGDAFKGKSMSDIVSFNNQTNKVVFTVANNSYEYHIPNL